ncbi:MULTISPECIES: sensor histidine kinase [Cryobacterium]|uniref:sensor histidine kinase n=1 Tax=Cryobacterium TaxID=69578 RepID=UPI000CD45C39|nr:hypothetical protein C3B60_13860 [Cryobacterium zongtaii]TFC47434.1 ATP-binding protein [Cryobacterium sp. TMN-39-2]
MDVSRLVLEVAADARVTYPDHTCRLHIPEQPVLLHGDESSLRQILLNLTSNATTYTGAGTTVLVSIEQGAGSVQVRVHDEGSGIAESALESIFEPFAQDIHNPNQRHTGPLGLGLTIARRLSQWLGGALTVTSADGQTEFVITLSAPSSRC